MASLILGTAISLVQPLGGTLYGEDKRSLGRALGQIV